MRMKHTFIQYFVIIFLLLLTTVVSASDHYEASHVRTWTEWINTDHPDVGDGSDDETYAGIRQRGIQVCKGDSQIDAVCRIVGQPRSVFNYITADSVDDVFAIPCNAEGLLCQSEDQPERRYCRDYEIRFECIEEAPPQETNLGVIAVAAGLSVFVPVICVVFMHVLRVIKDRRNARRRALYRSESATGDNTDRASQTDLPPTYQQLFGENYGSTETLLEERNGNRGNSAANTNQGFSGSEINIHSGTTSSSGNSMVVFSMSTGQLNTEHQSSATLSIQSESPPISDRRTRFPGMHLSVLDLFSSRDAHVQSNSPSSPESATPPPTYLEAIEILAKLPPKSP